MSTRLADERGVAMIIALMSMMLMMALGMALVLTTMTETRISANYREGSEALYAADAAIERVMQDLLTVPDWNTVLADGGTTSAFIDGAPGARTLPDGSSLNLTEATHFVRCGKLTCADADVTTSTAERPWGDNNPRWQLYAYGPMRDMLPTDTINSRMYVIVWVADDPSENDGDAKIDGGSPVDADEEGNPGSGVVSLLAHAYGPDGVRRVVEVTVARTDTTEIERGYTGQRGQDEQNRRARKAAVQTPGKALTRSVLGISGDAGLVKQ
jgi:Tfp pilus assembly protein PilX